MPLVSKGSRGLCTFSSPGLFCIALPPHPLLGCCMDVNYLLFHVRTTSLPASDLSHMQTLSLFFLPLVNFSSAEGKPQLKFHFLKVCLPWHSKTMPELSDTVSSFEQLLPLTYLYVWLSDWYLSHTLQSVSLYSRLQPIMGCGLCNQLKKLWQAALINEIEKVFTLIVRVFFHHTLLQINR